MYLDNLDPEHGCQTCWPPLLGNRAGSYNSIFRRMWAGIVAHLVECLPRMHEALGSKLVPPEAEQGHPANLQSQQVGGRGQEDLKCKVILGYTKIKCLPGLCEILCRKLNEQMGHGVWT